MLVTSELPPADGAFDSPPPARLENISIVVVSLPPEVVVGGIIKISQEK